MNKKMSISAYIFIAIWFVLCTAKTMCETNKHFAVIIPSRNNSLWYERNLEALRTQNYDNWHAIYINDASTDDTRQKVENFIEKYQLQDKITLINNETKQGAMSNIYKAVHMCNDTDIVVNYDGDDWFSGPDSLTILNQAYEDENIWMTYGSYSVYPTAVKGDCTGPVSHDVIASNSYRSSPCLCTGHLRTFYAWLFKCIKREDLQINGVFFPMTYDLAMMYPMLELSGGRFKYILDVLYVYNIETPYNDCKVDGSLQHRLDKIIRSRPRYQPLEFPVMKDMPSNEPTQ